MKGVCRFLCVVLKAPLAMFAGKPEVLARQVGGKRRIKTHPPRLRDCDRDRDDRVLDRREVQGAEGSTGVRHWLLRRGRDEIAMHSHCHPCLRGRGTGFGLLLRLGLVDLRSLLGCR